MGKLPSGNPRSFFKSKNKVGLKLRKNEGIRVPEVRLIAPDGSQVGIVPTREALTIARKHQLDLVEISASARPPVCRILDFGKYMYEISKKQKDGKSAATKLKEVKFRINIDPHDYMTKLRQAERFLFKGNKLKISLMFRGREMQYQQQGLDIVNRAIEDLKHIGHADSEPRGAGKNINVSLSPIAANQRKLKYSNQEDDISEEEDED